MPVGARLFVVAIVLLVVLFVAGIGMGAARGGGGRGSDRDPPWVQALDAAVVDGLKRSLAPSDVSAGCLDQARREFAIPANGTCEVRIPSSLYPVRALTLRLRQGPSAEVRLRQQGTVTDKRSLAPGGAVELRIYREGATVLLSCRTGCRLEPR